jgi:hypothetical protein
LVFLRSVRRLLVTNLVFLRSVRRLLVAACVLPSSPILVTLMKVPPKRRFLQEPHGVTSQKAPFFIRFYYVPFRLQANYTD